MLTHQQAVTDVNRLQERARRQTLALGVHGLTQSHPCRHAQSTRCVRPSTHSGHPSRPAQDDLPQRPASKSCFEANQTYAINESFYPGDVHTRTHHPRLNRRLRVGAGSLNLHTHELTCDPPGTSHARTFSLKYTKKPSILM